MLTPVPLAEIGVTITRQSMCSIGGQATKAGRGRL
jgi:hypothetical protein